MNWPSYILGFSPVILAGVLVWWEYRLKYHFDDGRTKEHKRWRKRVLWLTLALFILGQINSISKDKQARIERFQLLYKINSLNTNQTYLLSKNSEINSNQLILQQQNRSLLNELATNSSISLDLRERIVKSNNKFEIIDSHVEDLNAWETRLRDKLTSARIQQKINKDRSLRVQQTEYENNLPYYDYAIKTFTDFISKAATQDGDVAITTFTDLPNVIGPEIGKTNIAEISFQRNTNWHFTITFSGRDLSFGRRTLTIRSKNASLVIVPSVGANNRPNKIETYLNMKGEDTIHDAQPLEDYKKTVNDALGNLIAAELMQPDSKKK